MDLLTVVVVTIVFSVIVLLAQKFGMREPFQTILTWGLVIVCVILWCSFFGVFAYLRGVHPGKL